MLSQTSPIPRSPDGDKKIMRRRLSGGQKWFLKPYFPLIRDMFVIRSGLRFSFWALEVTKPRGRTRPFHSKLTVLRIFKRRNFIQKKVAIMR